MSDYVSLPIPKDRNLFFSEQVDQFTIGKISESIINIESHDQYLIDLFNVHKLQYVPAPIKIYIDSYGGNVYQILGLISIIDSCKTPIYTYVTGTAMSAGFLMLISGHKRFAYKHATILYHQLSSGSFGKLEEMKDDLKEGKRLHKLLTSIVLEKTKLTRKKLKETDLTKKDWYIAPEEALQFKIIDEIL